MNLKWYYRLTANLPRPLPKNETDYLELKRILLEYYGLKDQPATWATVAGQIQGTPINQMKRSYAAIANAAKRGEINGLAETHKRQAFADNNRIIEEALKAAKDLEKPKPQGSGVSIPAPDMRSGTPEPQDSVSLLQKTQNGLVPLP